MNINKINWTKVATYGGLALSGAAALLGSWTQKKEMAETIEKEVKKAVEALGSKNV